MVTAAVVIDFGKCYSIRDKGFPGAGDARFKRVERVAGTCHLSVGMAAPQRFDRSATGMAPLPSASFRVERIGALLREGCGAYASVWSAAFLRRFRGGEGRA